MFPKSSVFAVVALAAFVSLGALLFPQVGQAQECIWDCDLGSDFFNFPGENSPGFSIVYCFDQPCVAGLGISTGAIPNPSVKQCPSKTVGQEEKCLIDPPGETFSSCPVNIKITGNVVAVLKDSKGNLRPESAALATLFVVVKGLNNCSTDSPPSSLSRKVSLTDLPGDVFAGNSNITILPILNSPNWSGTGCPTNNKGILTANCSFPLGIDVSKTDQQLSAKFPADGPFVDKEVYHGDGFGRVVATRMCKGDANKPSSSIACTVSGDVAVGGFVADAVFNFDGNWSGAGGKTFNPKSNTGNFDIITEQFDKIVLNDLNHPVTASANGGTPITATSCDTINNQQTLRCIFPARDLLPNGCKTGDTVNIVVSGIVSFADNPNGFVKFLSTDSPTCNNSK